MRTAVKSIRLTHPVCDQLQREAERNRTTTTDIVRIAVAEYFDRRQTEAALLALEQRLAQRLDAQHNTLHAGLEKILSLAVPA